MKSKFLEITWLIVAILTLAIGIFETWKNGFKLSYHFYIFFFISISVYFLRRSNRIKNNRQESEIRADHPDHNP